MAETATAQATKTYFLMQNLIYPAFAGTLLYNFSQQLWTAFSQLRFSELGEQHLLWLITGLWFLVYFSSAFTEFSGYTNDNDRARFKKGAFAANFVEAGVILVASLKISEMVPESSTPPPENAYLLVLFCWLTIPITGGFSNCLSGRPVKYILSAFTILVTVAALLAARYTSLGLPSAYKLSLILMTILLLSYFMMLWKPDSQIAEMLRKGDKRLGSFLNVCG